MRYRTILLLFSVFNKLLVRSVTQINLLLGKRFNESTKQAMAQGEIPLFCLFNYFYLVKDPPAKLSSGRLNIGCLFCHLWK